jgi:phospholipid-binding lipoprotein MlaA
MGFGGTGTMWLGAVLAVVLTGCGTFSGAVKTDTALTAGAPSAQTVVAEPPAMPEPSPVALLEEPAPDAAPADEIADETNFGPRPDPAPLPGDAPELLAGPADDDEVAGGSALVQRTQDNVDAFEEGYDPWEPFNEKMFTFNRNLDRFVLKPAARAYMVVMPEPWQVLIANGFDNINFVPRFINSLLQGKWGGAGRELGRFLINSTAGIGGMFDPAKDYWGIAKSREDFGQTLGVWGSGPGPYLILPFMEPLTVRDGIGKFVDGFMDPLSYFLPFFWTRAGMKAGDTLNDRALNYDLFQGFEESVIDMYSAVRHGYLQRRQQLIKE